MSQCKYSQKRTEVTRKNKRITLPITLEAYNDLKEDAGAFHHWLDEMLAAYPELFPADIGKGYILHNVLPASSKLPQVQLRRIRLKEARGSGQAQVFTIAPSEVLPYMVGLTDEVEKALFLRRFGAPFWALSYVFGRDDAYWYRLGTSFGRHELVGTTVKSPDNLPEHLLADEKHVRFNGAKGYIATTVGQDCVLGAALALQADDPALQDLQAWAGPNLSGTALEAVEKLCAKTDNFITAFDYPPAHRTSNMIDRHMDPLARWLFSSRFFHGHWHSAELQIRSWALFHNFWPYCPRAKVSQQFLSPAHKLNGAVYHSNWLHNLLISSSAAGFSLNHRKC